MLFPAPELSDNKPIGHVRFSSESEMHSMPPAGRRSAKCGKRRLMHFSACPALEVAQSPALAKRSACHRPMACDQSAKRHDPVPLIVVGQARLSDLI
jgi:hypothetical protein